MILCFSATGNSKLIANALSKKLDDEVVSLNNVFKNDLPKKFYSDKPYIIVSPIYGWRLPLIIERLIKEATFDGSKKMYFVVTMGNETGNAYKYCKKICAENGLTYMGFNGIRMPENYIILFKVPSDKEIKRQIKEGLEKVNVVSNIIKNEGYLKKDDFTIAPRLYSGFINNFFNKYMVNSKRFYVTNDCIGCGKCKKLCPVNNIEIKDNKPIFKDKCISCLACIHNCPKRAIESKGRTENKKRYVCPVKGVLDNEKERV